MREAAVMSLSGRSGRSRGTLPVLGCGRVAVKPTRTVPPRDAVSEAQHHQSRLRVCLREGDSRETYTRLISTGSGIHDRRLTAAFGLTSRMGKGSVERFRSACVRPNGSRGCDCVNTSSAQVSIPSRGFSRSQFPVLHFGSRLNGGWSHSLPVDGGL